MYMLKRDKKDEELGQGMNIFSNLDKTMARIFNESPVNVKKCISVLTKILYINEVIGTREATECFFATTKLFQSKDPLLRRMVYLVIKDMAPLAQDVIIVTSSLTKDMTGKEDLYRGPAIRTLSAITDHTMIQAIERYMKQAIVDKNYTVASAALTSSMHLCHNQGLEIVKRWVNEIQEAVNNDNVMVQYHALGLLYQVRKSDRLAITKLFSKFSKGSLRSPYAYILLIRITCQLIAEDEHNNYSNCAPYLEFLESCLRHKSEAVVYEAASVLVTVDTTKSTNTKKRKIPASAISILQLFCGSSNAALRFAAVRTLNKVAMNQPAALTSCNAELESMITDTNRTVSTLAITTLLKIGTESCIDRLMKQITTYISEISDPFKITIVEAIRALCLKYPRKHAVMMNFLSSMLRDEGGYEYKKAIANTIIAIIQEIPEAKESGLAHLCEFIEDCEHSVLAVKILHLLGKEGPKTPQPSKYIRYIYNRVILEAPPVRAAAVSALAKFALYCEDLRESIKVLLDRCLMDTDDEVRDRATYYLSFLDHVVNSGPGLQGSLFEEKTPVIMMDDEDYEPENAPLAHHDRPKLTEIHSFIDNEMHISTICLEKCLLTYLASPETQTEPFDLNSVPIEEEPIQMVDEDGKLVTKSVGEEDLDDKPAGIDADVYGSLKKDKIEDAATRESQFMEQLSKIPAFSTLGHLFKSCQPLYLTEEETEYVVRCTKHIFTHYVVFQFDVKNTLNDQILENVTVDMTPSEDHFEIIKNISARKVYPVGFVPQKAVKTNTALDESGKRPTLLAPNVSYTCVRLPEEAILVTCVFNNVMKFKVKDCDTATGEISETAYEDEYMLEDVDLNLSDSMKSIAKHNFNSSWEELGAENELEDNFVLSNVSNIPDAIIKLIQFLGMAPCDSSEKVSENKNLHTLYLSGMYRGNHDVLARIKIISIPDAGITINMLVRSSDPGASEVLITAMG